MSRVNNTIDKFGRQKNNDRVRYLRGLPGIGFKFTSDGQYDMEGRALRNVASPKNENDAATQDFVLKEIDKLREPMSEIIKRDVVAHTRRAIMEIREKCTNFSKDLEENKTNLGLIMERNVLKMENNEKRIYNLAKRVRALYNTHKIRI